MFCAYHNVSIVEIKAIKNLKTPCVQMILPQHLPKDHLEKAILNFSLNDLLVYLVRTSGLFGDAQCW